MGQRFSSFDFSSFILAKEAINDTSKMGPGFDGQYQPAADSGDT
jgi:hypothetical protein